MENVKIQKYEICQLKKQSNFLLSIIYSTIISDNNDYKKMLKNWINPNKQLEARLLYRLSRDGELLSTFHELCDNKRPTLTIFKVDDGNIAGIYTPLSWESWKLDNNVCWKNDLESFIFNLTQNQKYKKKINEESIKVNSKYGPWIPFAGFSLPYQMKKFIHGGYFIDKFYENGSKILTNNNSPDNKYFEVKEVEVFQINEI